MPWLQALPQARCASCCRCRGSRFYCSAMLTVFAALGVENQPRYHRLHSTRWFGLAMATSCSARRSAERACATECRPLIWPVPKCNRSEKFLRPQNKAQNRPAEVWVHGHLVQQMCAYATTGPLQGAPPTKLHDAPTYQVRHAAKKAAKAATAAAAFIAALLQLPIGTPTAVTPPAIPADADMRINTPPNKRQQLHPKNRAQSKKQQAGPRAGAGAGRRTSFSEYLGACAMVVGRVSYCLSMLLHAATNFCPTTAQGRLLSVTHGLHLQSGVVRAVWQRYW
jgi:hypothetical protein